MSQQCSDMPIPDKPDDFAKCPYIVEQRARLVYSTGLHSGIGSTATPASSNAPAPDGRDYGVLPPVVEKGRSDLIVNIIRCGQIVWRTGLG